MMVWHNSLRAGSTPEIRVNGREDKLLVLRRRPGDDREQKSVKRSNRPPEQISRERAREDSKPASRGGMHPPLLHLRKQSGEQILDRDAFLFHRIAMTEGDSVAERFIFFAQGLEINR